MTTLTTPNFYHRRRRLAQAVSVALAVLVPAFGLFRFDMRAGGVTVLDRQIWFSDFFLVAGLWIFLISLLVMLYSSAGTVFCGWVCPQNILSEWANHMTHRLLGKRAEVSLEGHKPVVAIAKNKALNWILLGSSFLAASLLTGLIPLFYFYKPETILSFVLWQTDPELAGSLHWIYFVFVLIIFIDIAVIRHFWCRFACVYRVWQHSFRTRETLHVAYDNSRAPECGSCNYCETSCFIDLNPKKTEVYDSCINCGECIDACNRMHAKDKVVGLLRFKFGEREEAKTSRLNFRNATISLKSRSIWMFLIALLGIGFFIWGYVNWEPFHVAVYRAEVQSSSSNLDYRISVANKYLKPAEVRVKVEGLSQGEYQLSEDDLIIPGGGRSSINLAISPELSHGLHPFVVTVSSGSWVSDFSAQHFSDR
ncbi:4Fe-4S binding protein [Polynucleobacter sphagniphilus]|jgi:polyferredoxin|uniref:4Fe-4S binding protein n=1 Tax=Polynucleobacter sphagniphilus TaxID=1743169 RepID=UPI002472F5AB|nr:4Fe-4S binding protein [Polynucleobacter sphagniphilus]MDH6524599.1 polyferredoxin [Polynucleobacter sphagniphilus]